MRYLVINADDFGIGEATSQGILQLAARRCVTSSVMLVNSPGVEAAVALWRAAGEPMELGWHPTLTLDGPVLPAERVPSLVDARGRFLSLGAFLKRWMRGGLRREEIHAELTAQHQKCKALLGYAPAIINTHHHVQVFEPVGEVIAEIVAAQRPRPYMRLVREPWGMIWKIPGPRMKRLFLNYHGRRAARCQRAAGLLGNDWLIGVTDPPYVDPEFFIRWVSRVPGNVVELTCHPGLRDETLIGRDCTAADGWIERRVKELGMLAEPAFAAAIAKAGFKLVSPGELRGIYGGNRDAA